MKSKRPGRTSYSEMPLGELCLYMMDVLQPYLRKELATTRRCAQHLTELHTREDVVKLAEVMNAVADRAEEHFDHDEKILHPFLRWRLQHGNDNSYDRSFLTKEQIAGQHAVLNSLLAEARGISANYVADHSFNAASKLCYAQFFNFEQDMLKHIFLEEEVLFSRMLKDTHES